MITPKQAAQIAAQSTNAPEGSVAGLATAIETALDSQLVLHGRVALSCSATPPSGALIAAAPVIMEIERRYRAAGWATKLDGGTVMIETPPEGSVGTSSSRRTPGWRCRACGATNLDGDRCAVCRTQRS